MKPSSEKRLQQTHPALAAAVRALIADLGAQGLVVEVVQGLRTFAEQDELYAKGRTKPGSIVTQARGGESNHNYGLAVDLCPFTDDKPDWNAPMSAWAAIGGAAERQGLEWGGSWKQFLVKPHVQLPAMPVTDCARCYAEGGLDLVWTTASQKIGWTAAPRETTGRAARRTRGTAVRKRAMKKKGVRKKVVNKKVVKKKVVKKKAARTATKRRPRSATKKTARRGARS